MNAKQWYQRRVAITAGGRSLFLVRKRHLCCRILLIFVRRQLPTGPMGSFLSRQKPAAAEVNTMTVSVKGPNGKRLKVTVEPGDEIESAGWRLDREDANLVHLVLRVRRPIEISICREGGKRFKLEMDPTETVVQLKEKIEAKTRLPVASQRLQFSGEDLHDPRTLESYNIQQDSTVDILSAAKMSIFLIELSGETRTLFFTPDDIVENVKVAMQTVKNIPVDTQRLIYRGQQLENDKTLRYYNVTDGATFQLILGN